MFYGPPRTRTTRSTPNNAREYETQTETGDRNNWRFVDLHHHIFIVRVLPVFEHVCENTGKCRLSTAHNQQPVLSWLHKHTNAEHTHAIDIQHTAAHDWNAIPISNENATKLIRFILNY